MQAHITCKTLQGKVMKKQTVKQLHIWTNNNMTHIWWKFFGKTDTQGQARSKWKFTIL